MDKSGENNFRLSHPFDRGLAWSDGDQSERDDEAVRDEDEAVLDEDEAVRDEAVLGVVG